MNDPRDRIPGFGEAPKSTPRQSAGGTRDSDSNGGSKGLLPWERPGGLSRYKAGKTGSDGPAPGRRTSGPASASPRPDRSRYRRTAGRAGTRGAFGSRRARAGAGRRTGLVRTARVAVMAVVALAVLVLTRGGVVPAGAAAEQYCSGENLVVGANWSLCWEVRAHEGLAITHAFYKEDGAERRVLADATVAQIFVPYETGTPRYHDVAYGLGPAMQLISAAECDEGTLMYGGKVCREVHDRGTSERFCADGSCHAREGQAVALWSSSQMGAYNYLTRWEFHDDGTIEPGMGLAGVLQFGDTAHSHNLYWRLDLDIDGPENDRVEEFYRISPAWSDGSVGAMSWVPLLGETFRSNDPDTFRKWRVVDTERKNAAGAHMSYELIPHMGDGNMRTTRDEGFTKGELFVTRANSGERFVSTDEADLLSGYLNGESVDGEDVVLWYVVHELHEVRAEDSPYMPVEWIHFKLRARNFFDESPME